MVQIHAMRVGDVELRLRGHTLVLNWNSLTLSLLRQLCHAQHDPKHRSAGRCLLPVYITCCNVAEQRCTVDCCPTMSCQDS